MNEEIYDIIRDRFNAEKYLISVIDGSCLNEKMDNIECFYSNIKPSVGELIITKKFGKNVVKNVCIDYTNIQYDNNDEKGSEHIIVFI